MKKLLAFSFIGTIALVFIGTMFIIGIFDFNLGQSNLVGFDDNNINEVELHNSIVKDVHKIGIHSNLLIGLYRNLGPETDLSEIRAKTEDFRKYKTRLENYTIPIFSKDKTEMYAYLNEEYLLKFETYLNALEIAFTNFEENDYDQEKINSLKEGIENQHANFVGIHNTFVEILNNSR